MYYVVVGCARQRSSNRVSGFRFSAIATISCIYFFGLIVLVSAGKLKVKHCRTKGGTNRSWK